MSQSGFTESGAAEQHHLPPERPSWPLWPLAFVLLAVLLVVAVRFGFAPQAEASGANHPSVGKTLTTFRLQPLTGDSRPTTEEDLAGKVTLINFWGPWCGYCAIEFPHLVELVSHFRSRPNFQFFSVSSNANPHDERGLSESTAEFLRRYQADFATYRDPDGETTTALMRDAGLGSFGYPTTVLVGPDGVILAFWSGYQPGDENEVRRAIDKALLKPTKP
jgi:thiol-disulfide isomerase/thioredoxin